MTDIPGGRHGACTRSQAVAALGEYGVRSAVAAGVLVPLWPRVLVDSGRLLELRTRAAAALLVAGPDAVLCGRTAAWLLGCTAARTSTVHVLLPYDRRCRRQDGLRIHQGRCTEEDVVEIDGLPVLALDLVISELLCRDERREALACADQAVARHPEQQWARFTASVERRLACRVDRRGTKRAAALLSIVDGRAESPPESWLRLLVVEAGFPLPDVQHPVLDIDGELRYRLDLAWPQLRIALEYDGYEAHAGRAERDAARDDDLARRGWLTIRATADDLRNPVRLLDTLTGAFRSRRAPVAGRLLSAS